MPSRKRRTNSNSGDSPRSTKTASPKTSTSSATSPASFEEVFGKPTDLKTIEELLKLETQLERTKETLRQHVAQPEPSNKLLRSRWRNKKTRLAGHICLLADLIQEMKKPL